MRRIGLLLLTLLALPLSACRGREHTQDVAFDGRHAYALSLTGPDLKVFDLAEREVPVEVGRLDLGPGGWPTDLALADDRLYVTYGPQGLVIVDVAEPGRPRQMARLDTPGFADGVVISGTRAYVADQHGGLRIVDVGDPAEPVELAGLEPEEGGSYRGLAVHGGYAFVSDSERGLQVVDVSDPGRPRLATSLAMPDGAYALTYAEGFAYVNEGGGTVVAVDLRDPLRPQRKGSLSLTGGAFHMVAVEGYLLVAESRWTREPDSAGFSVIDRRDASSLELVARIEGMSSANGIAVRDGLVVVGDEDQPGLWLIDLGEPEAPRLIRGPG